MGIPQTKNVGDNTGAAPHQNVLETRTRLFGGLPELEKLHPRGLARAPLDPVAHKRSDVVVGPVRFPR